MKSSEWPEAPVIRTAGAFPCFVSVAAWLVMAPVLLALPTTTMAACSRADVDHFLSRGFNREQVVAVCGGEAGAGSSRHEMSAETESTSTGSANSTGDSKPPPIIVSPGTEAERELRDLLLRSVNAKKVDVDGQGLSWTDHRCVEFAPPNLAGRPRELCGAVRVSVARDSVSIGTLHRQILFFGEHGVELLGKAQQQWELDRAGLSAADLRRLAERTPAEVDAVLLPLHGSAEPQDVAVSLQRWVDTR